MNVPAILALPLLAALNGLDTVSISLFTLFAPESVQVQIAAGDSATLDAAGLRSSGSIARGELISIRLSGNRLNIVITGPNGIVKQSVVSESVRVSPNGSATLELVLPAKIKRTVRGSLKFDTGTDGRGPLRIVLTADRESAVASVVAAETSRREPAGLMAIAVVVRSFMRSHEGRHSSEGFDFCDTTHCQLYRGEQDLADKTTIPSISQAVAMTSGQILSFGGRPVEGYYTATCGGLSATPAMVWGGNTSYPYRRIVCRWCRHSRFSRWQRSADASQIISSLSASIGSKLSSSVDLIASVDQTSGFVQSVTVQDEGRSIVLSTDSFRRAVGLRIGWNTVLSPTFTIERRGTRFIFRGKGFGSQVGLCEEGAFAQAASGRSYREILNFYYPGAEIGQRVSND